MYVPNGIHFFEHALILEELWKIDPGLGQVLCSVCFGAEEILMFGSEEQKKKLLPGLVQGKTIMGFSITEPNAGSDACAASTAGVLEEDRYIINGSKVMIGNGRIADFLLVFCLTDPEESSRGKRHSIICVETNREGYEANKIEGKMGLRASDTANVFFTNVRVPEENLVGKRGHGWAQLMAFSRPQSLPTKDRLDLTLNYPFFIIRIDL